MRTIEEKYNLFLSFHYGDINALVRALETTIYLYENANQCFKVQERIISLKAVLDMAISKNKITFLVNENIGLLALSNNIPTNKA